MMDDVRAIRAALRLISIPRWAVVRAVLLGIGALGSAVGLGAASAWLIARASQMPPVLSLSVIVVVVRALGISRGLFRYLERLASHKVALGAMGELRTALYRQLAAGRTGAVSTLRRGDMLARLGADVDHVGDVIVRAVIPTCVSVGISSLSVLAMGIVNVWAGLWLAVGLIVASVLGPWLTARGARRAEEDSAQARAEVAARSYDLVDHATEMTVTGRLEHELAELERADGRWQNATRAGARSLAAGAATNIAGLAIAVLGTLVCAGPAVFAGTLDDVMLAVVVLTPLAAFESTTVLPNAALQVQRSAVAARRLLDLLQRAQTPIVANIPEHATTAAHTPARPAAGSHITPTPPDSDHDAVVLDEVVVGWSPDGTRIPVGSHRIPRGSSALVLGQSGSGKTTLLASIAGLIAPLEGRVLLSGTALLTAEDAHIFHTTVLENLRVARGDVTAHEADTTLRIVGLGPWLDALPEGLDTMLGAEGSTISGGERRRLLIARALVARAPILLIDEPSEHLDRDSASDLLRDLLALPKSTARSDFPVQAVIVASHDVSVRDAADYVIEIRSA